MPALGFATYLEEGVLENALHPAQRLDHVRPIVVEVPEFAVVALVGPPERVLLQHLGTGEKAHDYLLK
jgi:hypothetical protein